MRYGFDEFLEIGCENNVPLYVISAGISSIL